MDGGASSDFGSAGARAGASDAKVWVKDARHDVFEQGLLPAEVEHALRSAGKSKMSLTGSG